MTLPQYSNIQYTLSSHNKEYHQIFDFIDTLWIDLLPHQYDTTHGLFQHSYDSLLDLLANPPENNQPNSSKTPQLIGQKRKQYHHLYNSCLYAKNNQNQIPIMFLIQEYNTHCSFYYLAMKNILSLMTLSDLYLIKDNHNCNTIDYVEYFFNDDDKLNFYDLLSFM